MERIILRVVCIWIYDDLILDEMVVVKCVVDAIINNRCITFFIESLNFEKFQVGHQVLHKIINVFSKRLSNILLQISL